MRKIIVAALGAFGGTLGYGYILNAPKNTILPASFIGLAGYIVYILLGMAGFGTMSAYFFSTVFVSVVCELLARKMRTPSTIFLLGAARAGIQFLSGDAGAGGKPRRGGRAGRHGRGADRRGDRRRRGGDVRVVSGAGGKK